MQKRCADEARPPGAAAAAEPPAIPAPAFFRDLGNGYRPSPEADAWTLAAFPLILGCVIFFFLYGMSLPSLAEEIGIDLGSGAPSAVALAILPFHLALSAACVVAAAFARSPAIHGQAADGRPLSPAEAPRGMRLPLLIRRLGLGNPKSSYWREAALAEAIALPPIFLSALASHAVLSYFGMDTSCPNERLIAEADGGGLAVIAFSSILLAPVSEELAFRRVCFGFARSFCGFWPATLATAFLFAVLHGGAVLVVPLMILGIAFQMLQARHNSLLPGMLMHAMHNAIVLLPTLLNRSGLVDLGARAM